MPLGGGLSEQRPGLRASRGDPRTAEHGHFWILLLRRWTERQGGERGTALSASSPPTDFLQPELWLFVPEISGIAFSSLFLSSSYRWYEVLVTPSPQNTWSKNGSKFPYFYFVCKPQHVRGVIRWRLASCTSSSCLAETVHSCFPQGRQESSVHSSTTTEPPRFSKASGL